MRLPNKNRNKTEAVDRGLAAIAAVTLTTLRDTLLPKLVVGEIRVFDADILEEASP